MAFQYSIEFRSTGIIYHVVRSKRVPARKKRFTAISKPLLGATSPMCHIK